MLPKKNKLNNLSPFHDSETGLIKVSGRIHKSGLLEETKNPVILAHSNLFVTLLIQEAHEKQLHAGSNQTLTYLRQVYWIKQGRSAVKKVSIQKTRPTPSCKGWLHSHGNESYHPRRSHMLELIFWDLCISRTSSMKLRRLTSACLCVLQHVRCISSSHAT